MRERIRTPFFSLSRGAEAPTPGVQSPIPGRALRGRTVGNGRFLLLHKTTHTEDSVSFAAKDMVGGIDVEVELRPDAQQGYRLCCAAASPAAPRLPNLWDMSVETEVPRRRRPSTLVRVLRAVFRRAA